MVDAAESSEVHDFGRHVLVESAAFLAEHITE